MTRPGDEDIPRDEIADRVLGTLVASLPADAEVDGDRELLARNVDAVLLRRASAAQLATPSASRKWPLLAASAAALVIAGGVAILSRTSSPSPSPNLPSSTSSTSERGVSNPAGERGAPNLAPTQPPSGEAISPSASKVEEVPSVDVGSLPTAPSAKPAAAPPSPLESRIEVRTAAELFASANEARRKRDAGGARALYLELQSKYPRSAEAVTSYVTLGRLELDHARAQDALAQYDRYLASSASELREDALAGRASALEALGRVAEEKRAWQDLLAAYPDSLFAHHARSRLSTTP